MIKQVLCLVQRDLPIIDLAVDDKFALIPQYRRAPKG